MEAAHRLLGFPLTGRWPPVVQLCVHEEGNQTIMFEDDDDIRLVAGRPLPKSTLTAYFDLNRRDPNARQWLYADIPEHYTWNKTRGAFRPRTQRRSVMTTPVGRMHAAYPGQGAKFSSKVQCFHVDLSLSTYFNHFAILYSIPTRTFLYFH